MSFQSYLDSLGGHQTPFRYDATFANPDQGDQGGYNYTQPNYSLGQQAPTAGSFQGDPYSQGNPNWAWQQNGYNRDEGNYAPNKFDPMYVDKSGGFLGFGNSPDSLYNNSPLLARQYQESIADGGLGAAQAEQLRIQNEQQRLAAEQARQASRQTYTPQYQGGNIMGLMQYQPQQQQAPQQQAPQQGLLGGGLHRPGFVANPGAGNGQTGGVQ